MLTSLVFNLALANRNWVRYLDPCASVIVLGMMLGNAGVILKHSGSRVLIVPFNSFAE